ncbi:MAG: DUF1559 domain-containing protein [Zavarzinella sp.]
MNSLKKLFVFSLCFSTFGQTLAAPPAKIKADSTEWGVKASPAMDLELIKKNAIAKVRAAASRAQSSNNLKQIALAFHNYESAYGQFPSNVLDKAGKPILSWRVQILPYIEQENLWRQFKMDEPWDSKHNLAVVEKYGMPKVYANPRVKVKENYTTYLMLDGKGTLGESAVGKKMFRDITDGLSNTLLTVESSRGAFWTQPQDIPIDFEKDVIDISEVFGDQVLVGFADGAVRALNWKNLSQTTKKALLTKNGGEVFQLKD